MFAKIDRLISHPWSASVRHATEKICSGSLRNAEVVPDLAERDERALGFVCRLGHAERIRLDAQKLAHVRVVTG